MADRGDVAGGADWSEQEESIPRVDHSLPEPELKFRLVNVDEIGSTSVTHRRFPLARHHTAARHRRRSDRPHRAQQLRQTAQC